MEAASPSEILHDEVITAVTMSIFVLWVVTPCGLVDVSEEHTVSVFRAELSSGSLVSTYKSTRRYNPERRHQNPDHLHVEINSNAPATSSTRNDSLDPSKPSGNFMYQLL
jgi:hypothetical protein